MKAQHFYNSIAPFYGDMINTGKNLELRINSYKNLFKYPSCIADVGCGIGMDSIALSKNGLTVYGIDPSKEMIKQAKQNAKNNSVKIRFSEGSFSELKKYKIFFDGIISMGNTIAHLSETELEKAFKNIYSSLKPSGILFIHILNYKLIINENRRINNISVKDDESIIRFYDIHENNILFNILRYSLTNPKDRILISTKHHPHYHNQIKQKLRLAGFQSIKLFSSFNGERFVPTESKDLFVLASK